MQNLNLIMKKNQTKDKISNVLSKRRVEKEAIIFKNVKVIKDKERLWKCSKIKEARVKTH